MSTQDREPTHEDISRERSEALQQNMRDQQTIRELREELARAKEDYERTCVTIVQMHEAATGVVGGGPLRGVVEDVKDLRTRMQNMEALLTRLWQFIVENI